VGAGEAPPPPGRARVGLLLVSLVALGVVAHGVLGAGDVGGAFATDPRLAWLALVSVLAAVAALHGLGRASLPLAAAAVATLLPAVSIAQAGGIALAAGALGLRRRRPLACEASRAFAFVGSILLVAAPALTPATGAGEAAGRSALAQAMGDAFAWVRESVWRGEPPLAGAPGPAQSVPTLAVALAVALGLSASGISGARGRGLARTLARATLVLLVVAAGTGPLATLWSERETLVRPGGGTVAAALLARLALDGGLLVTMYAAVTLYALAEDRAEAADRRHLEGRERLLGPRSARPLAVAAALVAIVSAFAIDVEAPARLLRGTWGPRTGLALAAAVVAGAGALTAVTGGGRARATLLAAAAGVGAAALPGGLERLGAPAFLLPTFAAVAAGATWASHGDADLAVGRALRAGTGVVLLLLLALPTGPVGPRLLDGWPCAAAPLVDALGRTFDPVTRDAALHALGGAACLDVALVAALGFVALLGAMVGPWRILRGLAVALLAAFLLHPAARAFLESLSTRPADPSAAPLPTAWATLAGPLRATLPAAFLLAAAATADALRPSTER